MYQNDDQKNPRKNEISFDYLQNVDKIETICESTLHSSSSSAAASNTAAMDQSSKMMSKGKSSNFGGLGGFSLAHIKQHLFDSSKQFTYEPKSKRKR